MDLFTVWTKWEETKTLIYSCSFLQCMLPFICAQNTQRKCETQDPARCKVLVPTSLSREILEKH